jgi:hypothetical protein
MGVATPPPVYSRTDYALNYFLGTGASPDPIAAQFSPDPGACDLSTRYFDQKPPTPPGNVGSPRLRQSDITNGMSNAIFVGEKALYIEQGKSGDTMFQDDPVFSGRLWGTARGGPRVLRDMSMQNDPLQQFRVQFRTLLTPAGGTPSADLQ